MAIALFFRRVTTTAPDATAVYEFGERPDRTDRRLVIDTVAGLARAPDGTWDDPDLSRVARTVLRQRRETGVWPETGHYSS